MEIFLLFLEIWLLGLEFTYSFLHNRFFESLMIESVTLLFVVYELLNAMDFRYNFRHKFLWIAIVKFTWI